jgi:hypothetical protein
MCPLLAVALYIQVKLYALFINGKNEVVLNRQQYMLYRGVLYRQ